MRQGALPSLEETRTQVLSVSMLKIHFSYFKTDLAKSVTDATAAKSTYEADALDLHDRADLSTLLVLSSSRNTTSGAQSSPYSVQTPTYTGPHTLELATVRV